MLKAGDLGAGSYELTIQLEQPGSSGHAFEHTASMVFNGSDDNGAMFWLPIMLQAPGEGLHWFNVLFGGNRIGRIPFRILYQQGALQLPMSPVPPEQK
jgi:hypothetical protein